MTSGNPGAATVEKTVLLTCTVERAFSLFTDRASQWWPPERRHTGDPESTISILAAGRFFERARDGREVELGRVRVFEPPSRLVLDFYPGTDAEHPTEVEVLFAAEGGGAVTRVTVLHRATAASESLFESRAPRYVASWDLLLGSLAALANGVADR
jgi:uncharacterized protein YndB with AHSA1/START domain